MYHIRPATPTDINDLIHLLETLFSIEKDFKFDNTRQKRGLEMLLRSENTAIWVAEHKQSVIGMVTGQLLISTAEGSYSLLVEDLVVNQKHRRKSVASQLLESISNWGGQHGASRVQLLADKNNKTGLSFYSQNSWQTTDLICLRKYYKRTP